MTVWENDINWYIKRLREKDYFSFPGFSDSEWLCMLERRIGDYSAAGQLHTKEIGEKLREAFKAKDESYLRAVPNAIFHIDPIREDAKKLLADEIVYERDRVTDDLAAKLGGLKYLIEQLRKMDVYIVSNAHLKGLFFLNYKKFFEISTPNFHLEKGGIDKITKDILDFGKPGVYLFACGMSDAVMISNLHGKIKDAFLIDVGSMFDAFVGIGAQREWRAKLYADPKKWVEWVTANL